MLRPWTLKIRIRRDSRIAVFLQIAHALIEEIRRGRLAPGSALPGTRELAESLRRSGLHEQRLRLRIDEDAGHNEGAWAARFPEALAFLFGK